jgi:hypothetical protein
MRIGSQLEGLNAGVEIHLHRVGRDGVVEDSYGRREAKAWSAKLEVWLHIDVQSVQYVAVWSTGCAIAWMTTHKWRVCWGLFGLHGETLGGCALVRKERLG